MTKLIYDTETTGFPLNDRPDEHPGQARLVELGMKLTDDDGKMIQCASMIVKPEGWVIPLPASNVHGITTEMAMALGTPYKLVVATFCAWYNLADEVIAHNEAFDDKIMRCAIAQNGGRAAEKMLNPKRSCTMRLATAIVNLPPTPKMLAAGFNRPKAPNLTECVQFFFGETFEGAHRALTDAEQCSRVYFEMMRRLRDKDGQGATPAPGPGHYTEESQRTAPIAVTEEVSRAPQETTTA